MMKYENSDLLLDIILNMEKRGNDMKIKKTFMDVLLKCQDLNLLKVSVDGKEHAVKEIQIRGSTLVFVGGKKHAWELEEDRE